MKKILITRPKQQATGLYEKLKQSGFIPILCPTLEIIPIALQKNITQAIQQQLSHFDFAIFTSPNAVLYGAPVIKQYWSKLPETLKICAIGEGTSRALIKAELPIHLQPQENFSSEGLLALPEFQTIQDQNILILAGIGGRTLLQEELATRGAKVLKLEVYRRIRPELTEDLQNILFNFAFDLIVSTSMESLQNLVSYFPISKKHLLYKKPLIVISPRMAQEASLLGFETIITAKNAQDENIIAALKL